MKFPDGPKNVRVAGEHGGASPPRTIQQGRCGLAEVCFLAPVGVGEGVCSQPRVNRLREASVEELVPGPGFAARLGQVAADLGVAGARIFDLQIGLRALDGGAIELWTHDRIFVKIPGLVIRALLTRS